MVHLHHFEAERMSTSLHQHLPSPPMGPTLVMASVYVCVVEVKPRAGCNLDPRECKGATARCYVRARSGTEAEERVPAALVDDHFDLVGVTCCVDAGVIDWERPGNEEGKRLIGEAWHSDDVVYGRFDSWPHLTRDAPQRSDSMQAGLPHSRERRA
jgi:hypothetical protein